MNKQPFTKHLLGILIATGFAFFFLEGTLPFFHQNYYLSLPMTVGFGIFGYGLISLIAHAGAPKPNLQEGNTLNQHKSDIKGKDQVIHSVSAYLSTTLLFPNSYMPLEWSHLIDMGANTPTAHRYTIRHKFTYNEVDGKKEAEWLFYIDHDFKITSVVKL